MMKSTRRFGLSCWPSFLISSFLLCQKYQKHAIAPKCFVLRKCVFRRKPATDSDAIRPPIPTEAGHPFRSKPATLLRPA